MNKSTAAHVMTREVLTVDPDWSVEYLMDFLSDHSISGAPVVNGALEPIGVVSLTDIARNGGLSERSPAPQVASDYRHDLDRFVDRDTLAGFQAESASGATVRDIMTPMVFAVDEDTPVGDVADVMLTGRIHRVIVRREGKMVGVVTSMDLLPFVRDL